MKKILIIGSSIAIGGAEKQQFTLREKLEKDGFQVDFCFVFFENQSTRYKWSGIGNSRPVTFQMDIFLPYFRHNRYWLTKGLPKYLYRKTFYYFRHKAFRKFLKKNNYDWIIPFSPSTTHMTIHTLARLKIKTQTFYNLRGGELKNVPKELIRDFESLGERAHLLSNAEFSLQLLKSVFRSTRGLVLKNFTEDSFFQPADKTDSINLIQVANYYPEKDFETLFKSLKILLSKYPTIRLSLFCMFRTKDHFAEIQEKIDRYGVKDHIHLYYLNEDKSPLLLKATIGILATTSEGCSNSILEYLSYGLPVVTSAIPANYELLGTRYQKYLYQDGNEKDLAEKIDLILSDKELYCQLVSEAKTILEAHLDQVNSAYVKFKTYLLDH